MEEELATCLHMAATMLNRTPRDRFQAKVDAVGLSAGPHVFRRLRPLALDAEAHEQTEAPPDQNLQEPISVDGSGLQVHVLVKEGSTERDPLTVCLVAG